MNCNDVMLEIDHAIDAIETWTEIKDMDLQQRGAQGWKAEAQGWTFLIVSWPYRTVTEPDSWGYDGTAARNGTAVRLTRELAERAAKRAR